MNFATGIEEVLRIEDDFASEEDAVAFWRETAPDVRCEDVSYPGAAGQPQRARLYFGEPDAPTLLYMHGGGWCGGSIDLNEAATRGICAESGWNVLSISYRFAPAHPYPAGLNDCLAAFRWLQGNTAELGLAPGPIALGGASAGANLAMAACLSLGGQDVAALILFYGVFGHDVDTGSYHSYRDGPALTRARMIELFDLYDPTGQRASDPLIAPLLAQDLSFIPPACLIAAEHDVLLDDSRHMADRLAGAGRPHAFYIEPGVTHGFINRGRLVPSANSSIARAAQFLKDSAEDQRP